MSPDCLSSTAPDLILTDKPPPEMFGSMFRALEQHTVHTIGPMRPRPLAIPLHDAAGTVTGGLWANTVHDWLYVQVLVIPGERRGQGLGTAVLDLAETEARARGCIGSYVTTFTAPGFYEQRGYTLFGTLRNCPPGHDLWHYRKRLDQPSGPDRRTLTDALDRGLAAARAFVAQGDTNAALEAYADVLRLDPTHAEALTEVGELAWACGHRGTARAVWLQAMRRRLNASHAAMETA